MTSAKASPRWEAPRVFNLVLRNSAWSAGASVITALSLFGETVILARYLGATTFGVYVLATAYPDFLQQLLGFRAPDSLNRYLPRFFEQSRDAEAVALVKLLWLLETAVAVLTFLIVLGTAGPVARLVTHHAGNGRLMVVYAIGAVLAAFALSWGVLLRALGHFALSFLSDASVTVFRLGLLAAAALTGGSLTELMWARVGAAGLALIVGGGLALYALARKAWHARRARIATLQSQRREIVHFLINTNVIGIVRLASTKLDVLLVGTLAGAAATSLYRVALQFASVPLFLVDALTASVFPAMSRAASGERWGELRDIAFRSTRVIAAVAIPPSLVVAVFGHQVISLLVGHGFSSAAWPLAICLAGVIPLLCMFWLYIVLLTMGYVSVAVRISFVTAVVQILVIFILVPPFKAIGGAVAVAVMLNLSIAMQLWFVRRHGLLHGAARVRS